MNRLDKEKEMISKMIDIYYKKEEHGTIEERDELKDYALKRLSYCKFGNEKSFCSKCPSQCYAPRYKEKIKAVMRYSGPRMVVHHPLMLIKHIIGDFQK